MTARRALLLAPLAAALLAAGCASINTVTCDVSSFGDWPAGRAAGSYAFERLPSQQANAAQADALEAAARRALDKAGFKPAPAGTEPDVLVQIGARFTRTTVSPWDDPLWWNGGFGRWRRGPWVGPGWGVGMRFPAVHYYNEVALLLRDRASGKPMYETRAATDGSTRTDASIVAALFEASLADFPRPALSPRSVTVTVAP